MSNYRKLRRQVPRVLFHSAVLTIHATVPEPMASQWDISPSFPVFWISLQLHLFQAPCSSAQANEFAHCLLFPLIFCWQGWRTGLTCSPSILLSLSFNHFLLPTSLARVRHQDGLSYPSSSYRKAGVKGSRAVAGKTGAKITLAIKHLLMCLLLAFWFWKYHTAPQEKWSTGSRKKPGPIAHAAANHGRVEG